jgi:hypothetical protein
MIAIEDLEALKAMQEYSMPFQKIYEYRECPE